MATFQVQVQGLTSLSVGTTPTTGELTEFLKDGVNDVTNRWLAVKPQDIEGFQRESSIIDSNSGLYVGGAKIISVIREAGADGSSDGSTAWEICRKIPASMQSRVVDTESLDFASKYNPVYTIDDNGRVNVYPVASSNNGYKVFYVNNVPTDETNSASLTYAHSDIKYFPKDKVYLVVIYAGIKSLQANLGAMGISTFSLSASAPVAIPGNPSISGGSVAPITIDALPTAPVYTPPVITTTGSDSTTLDLTKLDTASWTAADYDFDDENIDPLKWFQLAGDFIQNEEDSELAQAQLQKISTYIQAYSVAMQSRLNTFNDQNVDFQAGIQRNLQQAQINMQDAQKEADLTLQASIQDYTLELQRVSTDAQKYQTLVATEVQAYQQEIAEKGTEYQWMAARLKDLKQEYDTAFAIAAPRPAQ